MESDEGLYHASPQTRGRIAHASVDQKTYSTRANDIVSLSVCSEALGLVGKIDLYKADKKMLIERKYQLRNIYKGQILQLWAQYFCLIEMGYEVRNLAFYEISANKMHPVELPGEEGRRELSAVVTDFRHYKPGSPIRVNPNKCSHCIYCNLCDKTEIDNVYT